MDATRAMPPAAAERLCDRAAVLVDHGRGGGDAAPDSRARTGDALRRQRPEHARSHARDRAGFAGALGPSCKIERASRVASRVC